MSEEIIKTIHVLGLQNFANYERMNLIEVSLDSNDIIQRLVKYKKLKYRFLIENILLSSNLENDTNVIFVTCDGLSDAKEALINSSGRVHFRNEKQELSKGRIKKFAGCICRL